MESLAASVLPETVDWEIVVVDNNSPDQTRSVVEEFVKKHPAHFRYVFEGKQGKSNALNTGIREARGDILAFVDDDVTVEPHWLHNLTSDLTNREWAGSGGRILVPPGFTPPDWLALEGPWRQGAALCAHFDFGETPGRLEEAPYGTNMAFRREMFDRYGCFRTDLGPRPGSEIRNEDTEFGNRLLAGGERLRYVPSAVVYHPVPEERVRKKFFRSRWFALGRALVRENGPRVKLSEIGHHYRELWRSTLRPQLRDWRHARDQRERFYHQCAIWCTFGSIIEVAHLTLRGQTGSPATSISSSRTLT